MSSASCYRFNSFHFSPHCSFLFAFLHGSAHQLSIITISQAANTACLFLISKTGAREERLGKLSIAAVQQNNVTGSKSSKVCKHKLNLKHVSIVFARTLLILRLR